MFRVFRTVEVNRVPNGTVVQDSTHDKASGARERALFLVNNSVYSHHVAYITDDDGTVLESVSTEKWPVFLSGVR